MISKLLRLHKDYAELYEEGLIGISVGQVQTTPELFKELSKDKKIATDKNEGWIELTCIIDNVRFITLI